VSLSRRSLIVRLFRVALPLLAVAIVGLVGAYLTRSPVNELARNIQRAETPVAGAAAVEGARYEGADADGRPYTLIAERASRDPATGDARLEGITADATLGDGSWGEIRAKAGLYAVAARRMVLSGGVSLYHDSGCEGEMEGLSIDLSARTAETAQPVRAACPLGEIHATGLRALDGGARVVFSGPVRAVLNGVRG
jgi:lipopolysaccharide export system protein LptC